MNDYTTKTTELTLNTGDITEHLRGVNGIAYFSMTAISLRTGAHWLSLSPADTKLDPKAKTIVGSNNPNTGLQFWRRSKATRDVIGKEDVTGVSVTRCTAFSLDLKAYFNQAGKAAAALKSSSLGAAIEAIGSAVDLSAIPGEAWIDEAGRVRKFEMTFAGNAQGQQFSVVDAFHVLPLRRTCPRRSSTRVRHRRVPRRPELLAQLGSGRASAQSG